MNDQRIHKINILVSTMKLDHVLLAILAGFIFGATCALHFVFAVFVPSTGASGALAFALDCFAYISFFAWLGAAIGTALALLALVVFCLAFKQTDLESVRQIVLVELPAEYKKNTTDSASEDK